MSGQEELLSAFAMRMVAERYAVAVDRGDGALFAAQFTPDGTLEAPRGTFAGREQLATVPAMMKRLYERTHHGVVGMVPVIDGGTAQADTYTYARHFYRDSAGVGYCYEMTIRYEDTFRHSGSGWLLFKRRLVLIGDATYQTGRKHRIDASGEITEAAQ